MSGPTAHSRFGASSAARWMACPGSIAASAGLPNPESPWAAEGTRLHEVASGLLERFRAGQNMFGWAHEPHGLTTEQVEVVAAYVGAVQLDLMYDRLNASAFLIEERVSLPGLHPEFFGTADAATVRVPRLTAYDLKCGAGVPVEVDYDGRLNPQLGYYLLGVIVALGGAVTAENVALPPGVTELEIVVVQPRLGGVKRREVAVTELLDLARDLASAARLADVEEAPRAAGPHCRFCLAKRPAGARPCPALDAFAKATARTDFAPIEMADEDLNAILTRAETIETWLQAVRDEARRRMEAGEFVPDFKLSRARPGNRQWVDVEHARSLLIEWGLPIDAVAPRKLVSPAEAERLARLHCGEDIDLADMVERKPGAVTVVRSTPAADFAVPAIGA